ncbi:MAG: RluA family pseudouridine synthase [Pyrinomonadaceae bacterium]
MSINDQNRDFTTSEEDAGKRLDVFLSEKIEDWSRSRLKKLVDEGDVLINGGAAKSSYKLRTGDVVSAELSESSSDKFEPENIPLDIVFEDEYLAVINKPAGMVVHPGAGVSGGTLANAIAYRFNIEDSGFKKETRDRIGIVHRLDKDTSGLIVVAKNDLTLEKLSAQFGDRKVFKSYVALAHGFVRKLKGVIEEPIARDRKNRVKMAVDKNGRNAVSVYKVRQRFERFTLLDVQIKTGRTHQIRVHLAHLKHPIVGDETYNEGRDKTVPDAQLRKAIKDLNRFYLHAEKLSFTHPVTKKKLEFLQPLPDDLIDLLKFL